MTRPERFDHYHYQAQGPAGTRKRRPKPLLLGLAIVALVLAAGAGLYHFRAPLQATAAGVAAKLRHGVKTHFADGFAPAAVIPFLKGVFTNQDAPDQSPQNIGTAETTASAAVLYTVELSDGGRIEGTAISVGREDVTITDDSGVTVRVDRGRVARIRRMPR